MASVDDIQTYENLMERLVGAYKTRLFSICKQAELTPPQFWALKTIQDFERTKMSPLADQLGLSLGAASTLVDRLVTRGLVERTTDPHDRRAVHVNPSPKGLHVLGEAIEAKRAIMNKVFENVAAEARPQLLTGLAALVAAWEALPPVGPAALLMCAEE